MALEWNTIPGIYGGNTENGGRGGECVDPHGRPGAIGLRAGEIRGGEAGARRRAGIALCAERRRRSLKQQASRIVGIISGKSFFNECGQRRVRMLEEALREAKHYTLLGGLPGSQEELNELLRSWTGIVEAVIFLAWPPGWNAERLSSLPIRFLFIDCELSGDGYDRIETDRTSGVAAAVTELIRAGRRRIVRVGMDGAVGAAPDSSRRSPPPEKSRAALSRRKGWNSPTALRPEMRSSPSGRMRFSSIPTAWRSASTVMRASAA